MSSALAGARKRPAGLLIIESWAETAAAARIALASDGRRITVLTRLEPASLPDLSPFDIIILGQQEGGDGAALVEAVRRHARLPVVPLYRPSVAPLKGGRNHHTRARHALALEDCRARVHQHLQLPDTPTGMGLNWGSFDIMLQARVFAFKGKPLHLTEVQSAILSILLRSAGVIVTKAQLQSDIFGTKPATAANVIEVHISRLRDKLAAVGATISVENVRNAGYVLFWHAAGSKTAIPAPDPYLLVGGRQVRLMDITAPVPSGDEADERVPSPLDEQTGGLRVHAGDTASLQGTRP